MLTGCTNWLLSRVSSSTYFEMSELETWTSACQIGGFGVLSNTKVAEKVHYFIAATAASLVCVYVWGLFFV